eukprot:CAMPEP_0177547884 /NCGR_PEP_ID=MMETSP0369-20130122/64137_1 /TAXON_ID=447022 ORGANISM="Scrippsiella hangoei-like, Strain SHHI-4" /NCGR_SAMPLE_ID=MMETSP0369 /ASSEMBLY_ACC=CAM_ASM_000364 /LENGTH=81 /DNA_ID=CAMNT_0019032769 /DNA_START=54 /DNA_END=295 /DNA_ORIENTATION=+
MSAASRVAAASRCTCVATVAVRQASTTSHTSTSQGVARIVPAASAWAEVHNGSRNGSHHSVAAGGAPGSSFSSSSSSSSSS